MNREKYRKVYKALGMTQRGAGRFLDVGERTGRRYAAIGVPRAVAMLLTIMLKKGITPEEALAMIGEKAPPEGFADQRSGDDDDDE